MSALETASAFQTGSPTHLVAVLACAIVALVVAGLARRARATPDPGQRARRLTLLRHFVGWGCLVAWLTNTVFWLITPPFRWEQSLPLHFCQFANLIGAAAVLGKGRLFPALLYFWAVTLCLWAFITPVLSCGPGGPEFWIFWIYHLFILLAVVTTFIARDFRPSFRDLVRAWAVTLAFAAGLTVLNRFLESNYGFTGPSLPNHPTLLDVLGPYPLRLLWMLLLGSALFVIAWLPWKGSDRRRGERSPDGELRS